MVAHPSDHLFGLPSGAIDPEVAEDIAREIELHHLLERHRARMPLRDEADADAMKALLGPSA